MTQGATPAQPGDGLRIDVICSDPGHPVNRWLESWADRQKSHTVRILRKRSQLERGDFLFLISCLEIIPRPDRDRYRHCLVVHGSDLPEGRGMSPVVWEVLQGRRNLTLTLLNAEDEVDSGAIWKKVRIQLDGHELHDEINSKVFDAELELMDWAVKNCDSAVPQEQEGAVTVYPRRRPADSRLDPHKTIAEQFDLMRISDPARYPAFFDIGGHRYRVHLSRDPSES